MSDDSLGGLGFTTPSMTRTSSSNTNANAGPSTRPTAAKSAKRQRTSLSPSQSLGDQGNPVMIEDDAEMGDERGKKGKSGKAAINGKGKGKTAVKNSRVAHKSTGPRVAPVAQADESEDDARPANGISELARIRQALDDAEDRIAQLSHQVEELCRVRETEPEKLLREYQETAERRMNDQQSLIDQLTSTVAKIEPLMRDGKSNVLQLLTREAADEEKSALERDARKYKRQLDENSKLLKDKEKLIADLQEDVNMTRKQLDAEIQRSKAAVGKTVRPPGSATRGGGSVLGPDEPKKAKVITFYEDLTDVLVTNVKIEPCKLDDQEEDCLFSCVYTFKDNDDPAITQSLHFNLRLCHEFDATIAEVVPSVMYSPLDLDKEAASFVDKLTFLNEGFTFRKEQLQIFLKTLSERVSDALGRGGDEDDDDIQIVE